VQNNGADANVLCLHNDKVERVLLLDALTQAINLEGCYTDLQLILQAICKPFRIVV
jgi:hypothetical protein